MEEANDVHPWNINYQSIGLSLDFEIVDSLKCEVSIPTLVLLAFDTLVYLPPWGDNPWSFLFHNFYEGRNMMIEVPIH